MKRIVAIGGGEIGRPGFPVETTKIDREIIRLTGKKKPRVLFIPTASGDSEGYWKVWQRHYGQRLECVTDVLWLHRNRPTKSEIRRKIMSTDIIYVGGGNTFRMLRVWKKFGIDAMLRNAWREGIVMTGLSAGSLCWFAGGPSDFRRLKNPKAPLMRISGLGLISALHAPHYDVERDRPAALRRMTKGISSIGIGIDNCCALVVVDDTYRIIRAKHTAKAHRVFWKKGKYIEEEIRDPGTLRDLLRKD